MDCMLVNGDEKEGRKRNNHFTTPFIENDRSSGVNRNNCNGITEKRKTEERVKNELWSPDLLMLDYET